MGNKEQAGEDVLTLKLDPSVWKLGDRYRVRDYGCCRSYISPHRDGALSFSWLWMRSIVNQEASYMMF